MKTFARPCPVCDPRCPDAKNTCANCLHYAVDWRRRVLASIRLGTTRGVQLAFGGAA